MAKKRVKKSDKTNQTSDSTRSNETRPSNRRVKDSVFTDLFSQPKYLLQLYRALHPEDKTATEEDVALLSLKAVLAPRQYNDLGFSVGKSLIALVEAQTSWSSNIILRILLYLGDTLREYVTHNNLNLQLSTPVDLPELEFYVVYSGRPRTLPETISLSETYYGGKKRGIEITAKVVSQGRPGDILHQYIRFTRICDEQVEKYGATRRAIEETIKICVENDVLAEYLRERSVEVMNLIDSELFEQHQYELTLAADRKERIEKMAEKMAEEKTAEIKADCDAKVSAADQRAEAATRRAEAADRRAEAAQKAKEESLLNVARALLANTPMSIEEIASITGCDPNALSR